MCLCRIFCNVTEWDYISIRDRAKMMGDGQKKEYFARRMYVNVRDERGGLYEKEIVHISDWGVSTTI